MKARSMFWNGVIPVAAAALVFALPGTVRGQAPSGPEVWAANCGRCHRMQPTNKYDARQWSIVVTHMAQQARMTPEEEQAVREFLAGGAERAERPRPPARPGDPPALGGGVVPWAVEYDPAAVAKLFDRQCAVCHGKEGRGDGPAAVGLRPKPRDLTDPKLQSERTDADLREAIASGKGAMPAFGRLLKAEEVDDLVLYLRDLGKEGK